MNQRRVPEIAIPRRCERLRKLGIFGFGTVLGGLLVLGTFQGFGMTKVAVAVIIVALLLVAVFDTRCRWTPRVLLAAGTTYAVLVLADIIIFLRTPSVVPALSIRHMYIADEEIGYRLRPGWKGRFNDGVVTNARYSINTLGHRDDEPRTGVATRTLLIGDSFTFGDRLDDAETIDRQIERQSAHQIDAYNLGVPGYGPAAASITFQRAGVAATHAVYLFYANDLRNDNIATQRNTVWMGFLVTAIDADGHRYTPEELDERIGLAVVPGSHVIDALRLRHITRGLYSVLNDYDELTATEAILGDGPLCYKGSNVPLALTHTIDMHATAEARGMRFAVAIIPARAEVKAGRHFDIVADYVKAIRASGLDVISILDELVVDDYFAHDSHFNASGAGKAAAAIRRWLE